MSGYSPTSCLPYYQQPVLPSLAACTVSLPYTWRPTSPSPTITCRTRSSGQPSIINIVIIVLQGSFFGYVLPVIVFSTFCNFPKFFEFSTDFTYIKEGSDFEINFYSIFIVLYFRDLHLPFIKTNPFRDSPDYSFYVLGSNLIFLGKLHS